MQSIVTCANRAGLEVTDTVFEAIAAAEATLTADERELGVCVLDIGAHSTELVVFFEGAVAHTGSIPFGGQHFTNDLAVCCKCRRSSRAVEAPLRPRSRDRRAAAGRDRDSQSASDHDPSPHGRRDPGAARA
jgi:Tfp pilus assembly PilM family ATPase